MFQIVIDNNNNLRYVQSGFLGHMNDAGQYALMPNIGDGEQLDLPPNVYLLGDKGYANNYPILTRYRADQLGGGADRDIKIIFNTELSSRRVFVEHVISQFKTYRAVKGIYRHTRWFMPVVADVCACLAQRRIRLQYNIH